MTWELHLRNIAGIREGETRLEPGLNAVRGANWQGKSSLLHGIETAMGTEKPLTEGEANGQVDLSTPEESTVVELARENGTVTKTGEPYLEDDYTRTCASLYAFLGTDNEVRAAVRRDENVEEVLTRPLDLENIDEKIADRKDERRQIEAELGRAKEAATELPSLEEELTRLETRQEQLRDERDELERPEEGSDESQEELTDARAERDEAAQRVERLEATIERTAAKLEERRDERESLTVPETNVDSDLADEREALSDVRRKLDLLETVYSANKRILDEDHLELVSDVDRGLVEDTISCWVCGNDATTDDIESSVVALGERVAELRSTVAEHEQRVEELEETRQEAERAERRKRDLDDEIADLETKLADREESLERATERHEQLAGRVETLSESVAAENERLTEVESDIRLLTVDYEETKERIEKLEARAEQQSNLESEYESLTDDIEQLRNRKDERKRRTREAFDAAIRDILPKFNAGFETARLTSDFDLVVAREGREASLDALSEGELELLGILVALAGHEAFGVAEDVPVILLDRLGALSDENLHLLVEYLRDRAPYLVFTAYPEYDEFDANEISPETWRVVSNDMEYPSPR
ncbi:archaea-specific SMC-related protein [Halococcus sp. AFM35]|uniref:archaea-specific SMC-related protein n=1 Tax=Halococcus sp. AFM35 TaxID=3421653 RepID=UPI003EBCE6B1